MAASNSYHTGLHDRRGFDGILQFLMGFLVLSILVLILYSWKLGLGMFLFAGVYYITVETVSAPPDNRTEKFMMWARNRPRRRPVLLCLGDSLTHGNLSASITPEIPIKLSAALGMDVPSSGGAFVDPLWVVNAGQNGITSHTILNERLNKALGCYPDFIMIWIGTNDVRAMYCASWGKQVVSMNNLPERPNMATFERNLTGILDFIRKSSPVVKVALCTLPPMGEDLRSGANALIREANEVIERVAKTDEKCVVIPVFDRLEEYLHKNRRGKRIVPVEMQPLLMLAMAPMYHVARLFNWNALSAMVGNKLLTDELHLNERGADIVVDLIVQWLLSASVAKAIAVKS
ncbi:hypothetical protein MPSEU_000741000 [Mayamaea pseudoterrestris]|nr:hypothetical protein MPSEU_000741000 [Mayamaea pseudoterrestris]